jgi:hypothetical protein
MPLSPQTGQCALNCNFFQKSPGNRSPTSNDGAQHRSCTQNRSAPHSVRISARRASGRHKIIIRVEINHFFRVHIPCLRTCTISSCAPMKNAAHPKSAAMGAIGDSYFRVIVIIRSFDINRSNNFVLSTLLEF